MARAMDATGNPSSVHSYGRGIRKQIEGARASIMADLGVPNYRLVFTSGASEALATVLTPGTRALATKRNATHLFIAPTEHVAALQGHGFDAAHCLPVSSDGLVDCKALTQALQALPDTAQAMVCVHGANNETGVLQPIEEIAMLCDVHQALFVCDLVQWAGRLPLGDARPAAFVVSAHKLGGPSGVGALVYDQMRVHMTHALIRGGGQERGVRAGTENAIGIAGFAAALHEAVSNQSAEHDRLTMLRDHFEAELMSAYPHAHVFGQNAPRLANTSCFAIPRHEAALALMQLDLDGVAISSGSACSSGKVKASHVLEAMDIEPEIATCALRLSLGFGSTKGDVERVLASIRRWAKPSAGTALKNSDKNANLAQSAVGDCA